MKKNRKFQYLAILLTLVLSFGYMLNTQVQSQAASKKTQVKKIKKTYSKFLKRHEKPYFRFAVLDLNKDGYPELICMGSTVFNKDWRIYNYRKGKMRRVSIPSKRDSYTTSMAYNPKTNSIYFDYSGASAWMGDSYRLKGSKLVHLHNFFWYHERRLIDKKKVSYKKIKKWYDHYAYKMITFQQNTNANRKIYL